MARIRRHPRAIAAALLGLVALAFAPVLAQDQSARDATDLYDRPVLAIDPGMHTAAIWSQAVDAAGHFAVTGGDDRTVRIWSLTDRRLLRTIWIPIGPEDVGVIYAVAISSDGSTIAAGGWTERRDGPHPIYLFERETGKLIQRIGRDSTSVTDFLTFSPDGRYLAATLAGGNGLRVFDRDKNWGEAFRDDQYGDDSLGAAFAPDGRLATTADDGMIRLYKYDPNGNSPNFRSVGRPVKAPGGPSPFGIAFSPDGQELAVGQEGALAVDLLDGNSLHQLRGPSLPKLDDGSISLGRVEWSIDGSTLFAASRASEAGRAVVVAWDKSGLGKARYLGFCGAYTTASGIRALSDGHIFVAAKEPCFGLIDAYSKPIWTTGSPNLDLRGQADVIRVSQDGEVIDFGNRGSAGPVLRFDVRSLRLSSPPPNDDLTFAANREGLTIDGWRNGTNPTLNGQALHFLKYDIARSLAIAPDAKRFFLGSSYALRAFDDSGTQKWFWSSRNEIWAVNASHDGRVVISADGDGAIRWHRADDGRELLALQVLPNKDVEPAKWDWVLDPRGLL